MGKKRRPDTLCVKVDVSITWLLPLSTEYRIQQLNITSPNTWGQLMLLMHNYETCTKQQKKNDPHKIKHHTFFDFDDRNFDERLCLGASTDLAKVRSGTGLKNKPGTYDRYS